MFWGKGFCFAWRRIGAINMTAIEIERNGTIYFTRIVFLALLAFGDGVATEHDTIFSLFKFPSELGCFRKLARSAHACQDYGL